MWPRGQIHENTLFKDVIQNTAPNHAERSHLTVDVFRAVRRKLSAWSVSNGTQTLRVFPTDFEPPSSRPGARQTVALKASL